MAAATSGYPVYLGLWTNWSHGPVLGSTWTMSRSNGTLLIAFIAFFITAVCTQFWRILCFFLHRHYSSRRRRDAIYVQRQAILRNAMEPTAGVIALARLGWAWRKIDTRRSWAQVLPLVLATLVFAAAFIVASGFSSKVALGNEVLVAAGACGIVDVTPSQFPQ